MAVSREGLYNESSSPAPTGLQFLAQYGDLLPALLDSICLRLTSVAGTNTITATAEPVTVPASGLVAGMKASIQPAADNTGAVTLDVDGRGPKAVVNGDGSALSAGMFKSVNRYLLEYDGTEWVILAGGPVGGADPIDPEAIARGDDGFQIMAAGWHPYDAVTYDDGNDGVIWDFAIDGTVAAIETPIFEAGYEYRIVGVDLVHNGAAARAVSCALFQATAGAYAAAQFVSPAWESSSLVARPGFVDVTIPLPGLVKKLHGMSFESATWDGTTLSELRGFEATYNATAQAITRARLTVTASSFVGGKVRLLRRLAKL